jgi:hypothetical protein
MALMTPAKATRPALIALTLFVAGCGGGEGDGRFEALADHVAAIDVPLKSEGPQTREGERRPGAFSPVQVAVMDPHDMWDARDAQSGLRTIVATASAPVAQAAAPVMARAMGEPAPGPLPPAAPAPASGALVQLGAYGSESLARQAWARLSQAEALSNLTPAFETVEVAGRSVTRLKVTLGADHSPAEVCQAAGVDDPWCRRAG